MTAASNEEKFTLNVFCVPVNKTSKGWELPTAWLGKRGKFGSIAQVCKTNGNCDYVMKVVSIIKQESSCRMCKYFRWFKRKKSAEGIQEIGTNPVTREEFLNEVELQKAAAKAHLSPPIIEDWICKDPSVGVIIMPMLDKTLKDVWTDQSVSFDQKENYKTEANALLSNLNKINT